MSTIISLFECMRVIWLILRIDTTGYGVIKALTYFKIHRSFKCID